ncbi:MAG: GNAT family N-acetyltransferase [Vulcanimicrobiota bacterium]
MELRAGPDLRLAPVRLHDADEMFELVERYRESLEPWLWWVETTRSVEDTKFFIASLKKVGIYEQGLVFAIRHRREFAGTVGFHNGNGAHMRAEIGYWLAPPFEGRGVMTKSCLACLEYAFGKVGVHRIELRTRAENERSVAMAIRLGFSFEGVEREGLRRGKEFHDHNVYSLLKPEWEARA